MAKWYGTIGFGYTEDSENNGVWTERIVERSYYGDIVRSTRRLQSANQVNSNITVSNELSIVADPYARDNFHSIRYAEFMDTKWTVTNVEVQYPRLFLSLGEVYNGEQA